MHDLRSVVCGLIFAICLGTPSLGAKTAPGDDPGLAISPEHTGEVVSTLARAVTESYVLEDESPRIASGLTTAFQEGAFDSATTPAELARSLTRVLFDLSHDLHLRVTPRGADPAARTCAGPTGPAPASGAPQRFRSRLLDGNVGVLEVAVLAPPLEQLNQAIHEVADADALIVDVRRCPGGSFEAIQSLASAFFDEPELLITHHIRGEEPFEVHTLEEGPGGARFSGKPVFVLTSGFTGSGCEELAFDLKYHDRAIVVGEVTAGAGLGLTRGLTDLGHGLEAFIPNMRPRHPRFAGGFQGVGVAPDVSTPAAAALDQAHLLALSEILDSGKATADQKKTERAMLEISKRSAREMRRRVARERSFREACGAYEGGKRLFFESGAPRFEARAGLSHPLETEAEDVFVVVGTPGQKLRLIRDDGGAVTALEISSPNGETWRRSSRVPSVGY